MKKNGLIYALTAYFMWGLFPVYWKWLQQVSSLQVISHRIAWSFLMLLGFILTTRQFKPFWQAAVKSRVIWIYLLTAILIGANWLVYVRAVNSDYIVEASLGYFINPLLSVLLGVIFLHERLRPLQWIPIMLAAMGVIYLSFAYGRLPWIALTLAFTFSIYGLVKKLAPLGSVFGLTVETGILFIPAVLYLNFANFSGSGAFLHSSLATNLLLIGSGLITTITLLMFASAAQSLPLSIVGIMEYIAPTIAFLLGVLVYKEPFNHAQLIGFGIVWIALFLFAVEGFWAHRSTTGSVIPSLGGS
jgi:chloramphenicol-sensitive protein RarD